MRAVLIGMISCGITGKIFEPPARVTGGGAQARRRSCAAAGARGARELRARDLPVSQEAPHATAHALGQSVRSEPGARRWAQKKVLWRSRRVGGEACGGGVCGGEAIGGETHRARACRRCPGSQGSDTAPPSHGCRRRRWGGSDGSPACQCQPGRMQKEGIKIELVGFHEGAHKRAANGGLGDHRGGIGCHACA